MEQIIADPKIQHIHTAVAIVLIGLLQKTVSYLKIKNRTFGKLITFDPTIVIQDGQFLKKNLKRIRYSIDNILQMLREKEVFDISEVQLGIVEANGNLSVLKKPEKNNVTLEDMSLVKTQPSLSYPLIVDGKINTEVLQKLQLTENWVYEQLLILNINIDNVFFASIDSNKKLHLSLKDFMPQIFPIIN